MRKFFNQAPLPFMGQKRRWCKDFKQALSEFNECTVFVDLFGGSGLLSRMVADTRPDAAVVYNDYDGYSKRIANIPRTNQLIADIRNLLVDHPQDKIIKDPIRSSILERIK